MDGWMAVAVDTGEMNKAFDTYLLLQHRDLLLPL
jgi:hypothetical protein